MPVRERVEGCETKAGIFWDWDGMGVWVSAGFDFGLGFEVDGTFELN